MFHVILAVLIWIGPLTGSFSVYSSQGFVTYSDGQGGVTQIPAAELVNVTLWRDPTYGPQGQFRVNANGVDPVYGAQSVFASGRVLQSSDGNTLTIATSLSNLGAQVIVTVNDTPTVPRGIEVKRRTTPTGPYATIATYRPLPSDVWYIPSAASTIKTTTTSQTVVNVNIGADIAGQPDRYWTILDTQYTLSAGQIVHRKNLWYSDDLGNTFYPPFSSSAENITRTATLLTVTGYGTWFGADLSMVSMDYVFTIDRNAAFTWKLKPKGTAAWITNISGTATTINSLVF